MIQTFPATSVLGQADKLHKYIRYLCPVLNSSLLCILDGRLLLYTLRACEAYGLETVLSDLLGWRHSHRRCLKNLFVKICKLFQCHEKLKHPFTGCEKKVFINLCTNFLNSQIVVRRKKILYHNFSNFIVTCGGYF